MLIDATEAFEIRGSPTGAAGSAGGHVLAAGTMSGVVAAYLLVALLALLAVLQLALAFGAPFGQFVWGGQHRVLPRRLRVGSIVAIAVYALIALIALDRAGRIDLLPDSFSVVGMWVVFGYMVLSIGPNAISRSKPERYTMVPVSIALAGLSLLVALG